MKTIQLDEQTSTNLERLSSERQITPEELIKQLIDELAQQPKKAKTTLEKLQGLARQQGEPEAFLNERSDLSDRDVWKPMIDLHLHQKGAE
jgi:hypothetical protein